MISWFGYKSTQRRLNNRTKSFTDPRNLFNKFFFVQLLGHVALLRSRGDCRGNSTNGYVPCNCTFRQHTSTRSTRNSSTKSIKMDTGLHQFTPPSLQLRVILGQAEGFKVRSVLTFFLYLTFISTRSHVNDTLGEGQNRRPSI